MLRTAQYPKQTALTLALTAALASMTPLAAQANCPPNSGTISSNTTAVTWSTGNCSITSSGNISNGATSTALEVNGSVGTLTNSGIIHGGDNGIANSGTIAVFNNQTNATIMGGFTNGLFNIGKIGVLTNNGTISGGSDSAGIANDGGSIGVLTNSGVIRGGATGIFNSGTIGTLTNSGTISSNKFGINIGGTIGGGSIGVLSNTAGGVIHGSNTGVFNDGGIGTLTNSGKIAGGTVSGNSATGIFNDEFGSIGTLTNSGVISGLNAGISNVGTIGTLNNSGTISGSFIAVANEGTIGALNNSGTLSALSAINNGGTGTIGALTNSGVIAGNITNNTTNNLTINGGTGSTFGTLTGFAPGSIGTITNTNSNLTFGSGNLLLNDNVNVGSNNTFNNNAATLQVNNSIAITGNYNQGEAATLQIGVANGATANGSLANDSGYGRLVVSGSATIASGSSVNLKPLTTYGFAAGQRFVVVDASTAGTNYNQTALNYSAGGFNGVLSGTDVTAAGRSDLVVTIVSGTGTTPTPTPSPTPSPTPTPSPATIPNAVSALGGLLNYTGVSPGLLNLFDAADALAATGGTAAVNRAGVQLAPVQQAASTGAAAAPTLDVLNVVAAHADSLRLAQMEDRQSGISTGDAPPAWGVWGQAFGGHASQNERDDVPGYSANYGGLLVGVDKSISDNWRAGGVFSYSNTAINDEGDAAGDNTTVNSYGLIGYASYTSQSWYTNLSAGVVQQSYSTNRQVDFTGFSGTANGHFSGQQYVTRAEVGYPLTVGGATVTPLASLTYSNLHQNGYTEGGGNGAALTVNSTHSASVKSSLGAKLEQAFPTAYGNFVPELRLQWLHEYDHTQQVTGASFAADPTGETGFTTVGPSPTSDMADVSVGVTLLRANNMTLTVRYELQAGGGFVSQTGSLRLRQLF